VLLALIALPQTRRWLHRHLANALLYQARAVRGAVGGRVRLPRPLRGKGAPRPAPQKTPPPPPRRR